ncbi:M48 family metalloprotease [Marinobacter sp. X15-166B]|uniref:M48 family metalloprotease n=1 Tax=Marinobacter sp. X15-166B TaxID=1897620 RepID=UPI00085C47D3|nr:M48 family metalloprotease [Marinobacter sp. X15-166B]OEY67308.1 peptidase M48 [Marinobacter sp. X15-166B]
MVITTYFRRSIALLAIVALLAGCSANPVTGKRELSLISERQERAIGAEQYIPTQQTQGGQFYLDPDLTVYVRDVGHKLAAVSDRPDLPYEFVVLNSSVPNAWALPSGKIAINRGLLVLLEDEAQLASVLGHEIVHAAARHSAQRMQSGMLLSAGMAGLGVALGDNEMAGLVMGGAALGGQLALAQHSQSDELESDHYGIKYMVKAGYNPQAAVELQQLFLQLSEGRSGDFLGSLFATHPPSQKRVNENARLARQLGAEGFRGKEVYQQKIAYLKRVTPAYEAYDEARKLAQKDKLDAALGKVNEAINAVPDEAMFYALRGQIHSAMKAPGKAGRDYDKAVALYPEMFSYRLHRGLHELAQNNLAKAEKDLSQANRTVPTSIAYLRLGDIAVKQRNKNQAIAYYNQAAQAEGPVAQEARRKLAALTSG